MFHYISYYLGIHNQRFLRSFTNKNKWLIEAFRIRVFLLLSNKFLPKRRIQVLLKSFCFRIQLAMFLSSEEFSCAGTHAQKGGLTKILLSKKLSTFQL